MSKRFLPVAVVACLSFVPSNLGAQTDVSGMLLEGMKGAIAGFAPIPEAEKRMVLEKVAEALMKRVTFREDGVASSIHQLRGANRYVEWKGLRVTAIQKERINAAEEANGVSKQYRVVFSCDASRSWDAKVNRWSEWIATGYLYFPSGCKVEEKNGVTTVHLTENGTFRPGPGRSLGAGAVPSNAGQPELPAGMRRN